MRVFHPNASKLDAVVCISILISDSRHARGRPLSCSVQSSRMTLTGFHDVARELRLCQQTMTNILMTGTTRAIRLICPDDMLPSHLVGFRWSHVEFERDGAPCKYHHAFLTLSFSTTSSTASTRTRLRPSRDQLDHIIGNVHDFFVVTMGT